MAETTNGQDQPIVYQHLEEPLVLVQWHDKTSVHCCHCLTSTPVAEPGGVAPIARAIRSHRDICKSNQR